MRASISPLTRRNSVFSEKRRLALVVGVDEAPRSGKGRLENAVRDARDMAGVLKQHCGFELHGGGPLLAEQAQSHQVREAIHDLIRDRSDDDLLLFYFSGHGYPLVCGNPPSDEVFLVTHDFNPAVAQEDPPHHISFRWLWQFLYERPQAGKVLLILDCCYSGNFAHYGRDLNMQDIIHKLREYFDNLNFQPDAKLGGLRQTLAATGCNLTTPDRSGRLSELLIPALKGEMAGAINPYGQVTLNSLSDFLRHEGRSHTISGGDGDRDCVLAYHEPFPQPYFPYGRDPAFCTGENDIAHLESVLRTRRLHPVRLGLNGMGGVGKSWLARELVYRTRDRFNNGKAIFWATVPRALPAADIDASSPGRVQEHPLVSALAALAVKAAFLPPGEDYSRPNSEQRARHLCRFLARQPDALLVLDNLDEPRWLERELLDLAGEPLQCTILYTSRSSFTPSEGETYRVVPLRKEEDMLSVLLHGTPHAALLEQFRAGENNAQITAARSICRRVDGLPQALALLRSRLKELSWLSLAELDREMEREGVLAIADSEISYYESLYRTFELSWQHIDSPTARQLFKLAACPRLATPLPLWLLALVSGMPESYALNAELTKARLLLERWHLIESVSRSEIQVHPLLQEFGQRKMQEEAGAEQLRREAAERVCAAFTDVLQLEKLAAAGGYWHCLERVHLARAYVTALDPAALERLLLVERRLDHETFFLGTGEWWPDRLPGLFYQQMYNRLLDEGQPLPPAPPAQHAWLRLLERVGLDEKELLKVFAGHRRSVNCIAFSPDGSSILSGSEDNTARLFDTASGRTLHVLNGHSKPIDRVAFSPDGTGVLTASRDHTARYWNVATGELLRCLEGHTDWVSSAIFSPDMSLILTTSRDGTIRLWETATESYTSFSFAAHNTQTSAIAHTVQPDLWGALGDAQAQSAGDLADEEGADVYQPHAITSAAFSPDGTEILLGFLDGTIRLCRTSDGVCVQEFRPHSGEVSEVAFSPDGRYLLTATLDRVDRVAHIYERANLRLVSTLRGHNDAIAGAAFSADGSLIATACWDHTLRLWHAQSGSLLYTFEPQPAQINGVAFSPSAMSILTASSDNLVRLWKNPLPQTPALASVAVPVSTQKTSIQPEAALIDATLSADGSRLLASYSNGEVTLWDTHTGRQMQTFTLPALPAGAGTAEKQQTALCLAFSTDAAHALTGTDRGTIFLLNLRQNHCEHVFTGHNAPITSVALSPGNGRYFLSGDSDGEARLWYGTSKRTLKTFTQHIGAVTCVRWSPDGRYMLTGSEDRTARLWWRKGRAYQFQRLIRHDGDVLSAAFSPDSMRVFTGSQDRRLCAWDTATGKLLAVLDGQAEPIRLLACSPGGGYLLSGGVYDQVRVWAIGGDEPYRLIAAFATGRTIQALGWLDERQILLADDAGPHRCPRLYHLSLENADRHL